MSGLSFVNDSPSAPMTFSMEVEPSVATLPFVEELPQPLSRAAPKESAAAAARIFFMRFTSFNKAA